ncbi:hypothetical protein G4H71_03200 [Rhodococcus triatomae]|uniref:PPE family protein n=1 Tax=Rhodococcus triatomae TaxID=300028 RepID=A0A1G8M9R0_9NOCA|nr:hypothetical protein [Rhodococcus triatomae]QNG18156.1 hypothetical protein G4H72_04845 [Rhodococcus triatomae]QNG22174.1 hypothetical protein G4H71_03200 [Rhodococcus triatomae]SDI64615.1 hypothetical protein SAMN05444695_109150 [Rhodococcus triatomae]
MTEPIYVQDVERFDGSEWSLEQLRDLAQSMNPGTVEQVQRTWRALGAEANTKIVEFADAVRREIAASWQGDAASAADQKTANYSRSAEAVSTQLDGVALSLDPIYQAASSLKGGAVPEVMPLTWWDKITPWKTDSDDEYYRRRDEALEAINTIYPPGVKGTDGSVPVFPPLKDVVEPPDPGADPRGRPFTGGTGGGSGGTSGGGSGGVPVDPTGDISGDVGTGVDPSGPSPTDSGVSGLDPSTAPQLGGDPASTAAASAGAPLGGGPGAGIGADGFRPSGGGGGGGLGAAGTGGAGGGLGGGGLLGGVPGGQPGAGGTAPASGARPGAMGAAPGRGMGGGMGGMMGAPGARGGGSDDKEHKTPDYLVTLDNGNELIGKLPTTVPPVIGA